MCLAIAAAERFSPPMGGLAHTVYAAVGFRKVSLAPAAGHEGETTRRTSSEGPVPGAGAPIPPCQDRAGLMRGRVFVQRVRGPAMLLPRKKRRTRQEGLDVTSSALLRPALVRQMGTQDSMISLAWVAGTVRSAWCLTSWRTVPGTGHAAASCLGSGPACQAGACRGPGRSLRHGGRRLAVAGG
jgi:hypothetical protein